MLGSAGWPLRLALVARRPGRGACQGRRQWLGQPTSRKARSPDLGTSRTRQLLDQWRRYSQGNGARPRYC